MLGNTKKGTELFQFTSCLLEDTAGFGKNASHLLTIPSFMQSLESRSVVGLKKEIGNIFHLDVHYVCMLVQRFQPQGRRFTNFHYYYYFGMGNTANQLLRKTRSVASPHFEHRFRAP